MASSTGGTWPPYRVAIDAALDALCARTTAALPPPVGDAIRYALLGEGKRIRGILLLLAYQAGGGTADAVDLAAAVEVVHAYSLVHDDLPCMDDDDLRRGQPTVHRAFGVQVASAAGLAMVPLAVRATLDGATAVGLDAARTGRAVELLMRASGAGGMIGGQLLDLMAESRSLSLAELDQVHRGKTGALISVAAELGGLAAGVDDGARSALVLFGTALGLAFQITDDILDVTATSAVLGKMAGRDLALGKSTYPTLVGVDGAQVRARGLIDEACAGLSAAGLLTPDLERIAQIVVDRQS